MSEVLVSFEFMFGSLNGVTNEEQVVFILPLIMNHGSTKHTIITWPICHICVGSWGVGQLGC